MLKVQLSHEEVEKAKDWLADCSFRDIADEDEIYEMSDAEIQKAVSKHYDGGIHAFKQSVNTDR
jgi:hypothetical protein